MILTPEQTAEVVTHLGNGARIVEAARMAHVPYSSLAEDWNQGRSAAERGDVTPESTFYIEAQAARSRHIATARAQAQAAAGSRESADLLSYVRALESEQEPLTDNADDTPNATRLFDHADPNVRAAAKASREASRELLRALVAAA